MVRLVWLFGMRHISEPRFRKFLVVGGIGTCIDFLLFYLFLSMLGWPIVLSNILSYGTGLTSSFFMNRIWTFADSRHRSKKRLPLALLIGYLGLMLNTALVWLFALIIHVWVGKVLAVVLIIFYNYLTNKYIIFSMNEE